jgi:hypothetical protein
MMLGIEMHILETLQKHKKHTVISGKLSQHPVNDMSDSKRV